MAESNYEIGIALNFDQREAEQLKKLPEEVRRRWEALNQEISKGAPLEGARAGLLQQSSGRLQELGTRASAQGFLTPQQSAESQRLLSQQQRIWRDHWTAQEQIAKQGSTRLLEQIDDLQKQISQAEKQGDTQRQQQLSRQLVSVYQQYERGGETTAARVEEIRGARKFQESQFEETRAQFEMFPTGEFVSRERQQRAQEQIQRVQERTTRQRERQQQTILRQQERQQSQVEKLQTEADRAQLRAAEEHVRSAREQERGARLGGPLGRAQAEHARAQAEFSQAQARTAVARAAVGADPFAQVQMAAARAAQAAAQAQVIQTSEALAAAYGQQQPDPTQGRGVGGMRGFLGSFGRGLLGFSLLGGAGYLISSRLRRDFGDELQRGMGVADLSQRLWPGGMPYDAFREFAGAIHPTASPQESTEFLAQYSGLAGIGNLRPEQMRGRTREAFGLTRAFGFAPQEGARLFGGGERLGIDQRRLAESMGESIAQAQMRGREGEMFEAVIRMSESLVERLGRAPDIDRIAGVLGRLGESGLPGLQGSFGAQRVQGFEQAVQGTNLFNLPDMRTPLLMGAMARMGVNSPGEMMRLLEQGPLANPELAKAVFAEFRQFGGIEGDFGPVLAKQLGLPVMPEQFRAMEHALTTAETPEKARAVLAQYTQDRRPEAEAREELALLYQTEARLVRLGIPIYLKMLEGVNASAGTLGDFNQVIAQKLQEMGATPKWAERGADAATLALLYGVVKVGWGGLKAGWGVLSKGLGGSFSSGAAVEAATRSVPFWTKAGMGVGGAAFLTAQDLLFPSATAGAESELTPEGLPKAARNIGALIGGIGPALPPWLEKLHRQASQKYGVPPEVGRAVQLMENQQFDPNAVSSKGAIGLMQVMPGMYGKTAGELRDPATNIDTAYQLLTELKYRFGGEWGKVMGAYEYGEPRYRKLIESGREMTGYREKAEGYLTGAGPAPDLTEAIRMMKEQQKIQIAFAPMTIIVRNERGDVIETTTAQPEIKPTGDYSAPTTSPTAVVR